MDKSEWGEGPWQEEPDEMEWTDEVTGLKCCILRSWMGMWLGYVVLPPGHPAFGMDYHSDAALSLDVHGGLTYSEERDGMWELGFDCGHAFDLAPGMQTVLRKLQQGKPWMENDLVYRNIEYVRRECANLAWQLKQMGEVL